MRADRPRNSGFTVLELALVIGIIGIVLSVAVPATGKMRGRAKEGSVVASVQCFQLQLEASIAVSKEIPAHSGMFNGLAGPTIELPANPIAGGPTQIGPTDTFSAGNVGYAYDAAAGLYTIVGFGATPTSGPAGDGVVVRVEGY